MLARPGQRQVHALARLDATGELGHLLDQYGQVVDLRLPVVAVQIEILDGRLAGRIEGGRARAAMDHFGEVVEDIVVVLAGHLKYVQWADVAQEAAYLERSIEKNLINYTVIHSELFNPKQTKSLQL